MAIVFQGQNPSSRSTPWNQALSPLAQALGGKINENRQQQQNIQQGSMLQSVLKEIGEKGPEATFEEIAQIIAGGQGKGLSPKIGEQLQEHYGQQSRLRESILSKEKENQAKENIQKIQNPATQKWAYEQIGKGDALKQLTNSLNEVEKLNNRGFTGPIEGKVPSWAASKEADAVRKAIVAESTQILNVHKSMFPRGLTQGEFKDLGQKITSPSNTKEANASIIEAYRRQAAIQQKKINSVEEAVNKYGFDPMLPFIVSGIQKQYDEEEANVNREMFQKVTGEKPVESITKSEMGEGGEIPGAPEGWRSQQEKTFSTRDKKTGEMHHGIPIQYFEEASQDPDYEVIESERDVSPKKENKYAFGETEQEREDRLAEKRRLLRRK